MINSIVTHPGGAHKDEFLACAVLLSKDSLPIYRREPTEVDLADLEDVKDLLPHLEDDSLDDRTVASILKKISKEDILYYLNNSALSRDTFEAKVR